MKNIMISNISVEVERKKIKNMYLKILPPEGKVHITAPLRLSEEEIKRFVITKMDWINEQQIKIHERHIHQEPTYTTGEEIFVWGHKLWLTVIEQSGRPGISFDRDRLILKVKTGSSLEQRKRILDKGYRESLEQEIPQFITKWEQIIGVKSHGFSIRDMKTRWGTCNIRTKNICLSLHLAKKSPKCLEYVVVHELVHLLESSHNSVFKGYLDHYMPEWREIKKEMKGAVIS